MRSPRRVCSRGSSQTAHSLPTKVRSRRDRLRSEFMAPTVVPDLEEPSRELMEPTEADDRCELPRKVPLAMDVSVESEGTGEDNWSASEKYG
jgi:hypothetical protein